MSWPSKATYQKCPLELTMIYSHMVRGGGRMYVSCPVALDEEEEEEKVEEEEEEERK